MPRLCARSIFHVSGRGSILKTWHGGIVPPGRPAGWARGGSWVCTVRGLYAVPGFPPADRRRATTPPSDRARWPPSGLERATRQTAAPASPASPPPPPACLPATDAAYASGLGRRRGSAAPTSTRLTGRSSTSVCCSLRHTSFLRSHRQPPPSRPLQISRRPARSPATTSTCTHASCVASTSKAAARTRKPTRTRSRCAAPRRLLAAAATRASAQHAPPPCARRRGITSSRTYTTAASTACPMATR